MLICNRFHERLANTGKITAFMGVTLFDALVRIIPIPVSFSALVRGDPLRIYGKALRFLKLESSRQLTVKIW